LFAQVSVENTLLGKRRTFLKETMMSKTYELVWHVVEYDRAWFTDHPDREYRMRPCLYGEGTATILKRRLKQVTRMWFMVRRDLEYAAISPVVTPVDDEELCRLLFKAHVGLGPPKTYYLKKAKKRWIELLEQMAEGEERELALSILVNDSSLAPRTRGTGRAEDGVLSTDAVFGTSPP
jgi:hypothetical protein